MKSDFLYPGGNRCQLLKSLYICLQLIVMVAGLAVVFIGAFSINSSVSRTVSIGAVCLGTVMSASSFMGWFGASISQLGFLHIYSRSTGLVLLIELATLVVMYLRRTQADQYGSMMWDFFYRNDPHFLYDIEFSLHCCGYTAYWDRAVPQSCTWGRGTDHGCNYVIDNIVFQYRHQITATIIFVLGVQFILMVMTTILITKIERDIEDEIMYMLLLPQQSGSSISPTFSRQPSRPSVLHHALPGSQLRVPRYGSIRSSTS